MITAQGSPEGIQDVWMTGYVDGSCPPDDKHCERDGEQLGKVSYLGGHEYSVRLPISENPDSQGTRLFLQSLFEAPCASEDGQPRVRIRKSAPEVTFDGTLTYELVYQNQGPGVVLDATISDALPEGATFVSATEGGLLADGVVTWVLGNLSSGAQGAVAVTVTFEALGAEFRNSATLSYRVGVNPRSVTSNTVATLNDLDADGDGVGDSRDVCPDIANPLQDLDTDPANCGRCGSVCANGVCAAGACGPAVPPDAGAPGVDAGANGPDAGDPRVDTGSPRSDASADARSNPSDGGVDPADAGAPGTRDGGVDPADAGAPGTRDGGGRDARPAGDATPGSSDSGGTDAHVVGEDRIHLRPIGADAALAAAEPDGDARSVAADGCGCRATGGSPGADLPAWLALMALLGRPRRRALDKRPSLGAGEAAPRIGRHDRLR